MLSYSNNYILQMSVSDKKKFNLKLEIASAIPASNEIKTRANNSAAQGLRN